VKRREAPAGAGADGDERLDRGTLPRRLLQRRGPIAAGEIAVCTGLTTASVTALVDRLERRSFVRRLPDPTDRRRVLVEVTEHAVARFAELLGSTARSLGDLYDTYTVAQLEVVVDFLTRNAERLRGETANLQAEG